jgi:Rieske Fe-S protein
MNEQDIPRRNFMIKAIAGIAVFVGAAVAVPLAGFGILPVLRKKEPGWSDAGSVKELSADVPQERRFDQMVKNGWQEDKVERAVWLVRKRDGSVVAFAPACPHLGCGYRWFPAEKRFKCPCHVSIFDIDGKVLAGPAPRALDALETKVEDGRVLVRFQIFQVGTSTKSAA